MYWKLWINAILSLHKNQSNQWSLSTVIYTSKAVTLCYQAKPSRTAATISSPDIRQTSITILRHNYTCVQFLCSWPIGPSNISSYSINLPATYLVLSRSYSRSFIFHINRQLMLRLLYKSYWLTLSLHHTLTIIKHTFQVRVQ